MKAIYIVPGGVFGGAHNQVLQLHPYMQELGHEITVVLPKEPGNAAAKLTAAGVQVLTIRLRRIRDPRKVWKNFAFFMMGPLQILRLVLLWLRLKPDVVQVHGVTQVDVALSVRFCRIPLVWQLLDTRAPQVLCRAFRPFLQSLPQVVMSTGSSTLDFHLLGQQAKPKVELYLPPARQDLLPDDIDVRDTARRVLSVAEGELCIVSVGNLNPQKGFENLLRAASRSAQGNMAVRIRGSVSPQHPGYAADLVALAETLGLFRESVGEFESSLDVPGVLAAADVLCVPSEARSEGIPTIILEAMRYGLPILAADVGSIGEVVTDGVEGWLHRSGDIDALADHLSRLSREPDQLGRFSKSSRAKAQSLRRGAEWGEINVGVLAAAIVLHRSDR